jgi:hypothetical protein
MKESRPRTSGRLFFLEDEGGLARLPEHRYDRIEGDAMTRLVVPATLLIATCCAFGSETGPSLKLSFPKTPDWAVRCNNAIITRLEDKEDINVISSIKSLDKNTSNRRYEISFKDSWGESFQIACSMDGELRYESRHKIPLKVVPPAVREAAEKWAPHATWDDTAMAETPRGKETVFEISGELSDRKIKCEVLQSGTFVKSSKLPVVQEARNPKGAPQEEVKKGELPQAIKTAFAERYKDAVIVKFKSNADTWLMSTVGAFDLISEKYELTAADKLNEKFKLVYTPAGKLYEEQEHDIALDAVPANVVEAAKKWAPDGDWRKTALARTDAGKPSVYTLTADIGKKTVRATINEFGAIVEADKLPKKK